MTRGVTFLVGGLVAAIAVLTVALGVALIDGHDDDGMMMGGRGNDNYMGMMQAMGRMESDQMLQMMRSVLGEEAFKRMQQHMAEHRGGMPSIYDNSPGGMMHQMMDGMMQRMPDDRTHSMPMMNH